MDWLSYISQNNWLAVLLALIANMAIGFVWYIPAVTLIDSGHDLVAMTAAGAIIGAKS